jgi:hypothetical protein
MGTLLRRQGRHLPRRTRFVVGATTRLLWVLVFGVVLTFVSFWLMGDTLVERYANLILLRQYSEDVERTAVNVYAFSLTQSWAWLSVAALFVISETRGRGLLWYLCLAAVIAFAVLGASRRSIFIPILLAYLTLVLLMAGGGQMDTGYFNSRSSGWIRQGNLIRHCIRRLVRRVGERYSTLASALIRTASDIGITLVESLGTVISWMSLHGSASTISCHSCDESQLVGSGGILTCRPASCD